MMKSKPEKNTNPKPNLLVTINFDPNKWEHSDWLMGAIVEYCGVHLENRIANKKSVIMTVLFETIKEGAEFYLMLDNAKIQAKINKEEI